MIPLGNPRRRRRGAVFLGVALALLLAGQTVLRPHLGRVPFILYWLLCFVFSLLAIFTAARELRTISRQAREERRDLLAQTLSNRERKGDNPDNPRGN